MSAKPTPGPYHIARGSLNKSDGPVVCGDDGIMAIAMFLDFGIGPEQAEANARAWVDGIAAIEKLERIEQTMCNVELDNNEVVAEIRSILSGKP